MSGRYALIEMAFVYSIVLGFAFRELRRTKRDSRGDPKRDEQRDETRDETDPPAT